jgi:exonuclease III
MPRQPVQGRQPAAAGLRLATHNVHGLQAHIGMLAAVWVQLRLDVVLVQETWVQFYDAPRVVKLLQAACKRVDPHHSGFEVFWGFNTAANAGHSAGVAVLVRKALVDNGHLTVAPQQVQASNTGRLVRVPVRWGGHTMSLVSVYVPNAGQDQRGFVEKDMRSAIPLQGACIVGGDFNFVQDPALDKIHVSEPAQVASAVAARAFMQQFSELGDVFRLLHPTRRVYTYHCHTSASRLDRIYASIALNQYVQACGVGAQSPSDHRPVVMQMGARVAPKHGRGLRRARVSQVWEVQATREQLQQGVQALAEEAPQDDHALLAWWPVFKGECLLLCERLAREARQLTGGVVNASRQQAAACLAGAFEQVERATGAQQLEQALQCVLQARQQWREQVMQQVLRSDWEQRREWIHTGERPNPVLTSAIRTKAAAQDLHVAGLQCPVTGRMVQEGKPVAQVAAEYWGRVSKEHTGDPQAREEVLAAVRAANLTVPADAAEAVGDPLVMVAEVRGALKRSKPGKAPGLDGLPVEMYRRCMGVCAPVLARVYSAMGATGHAPRGFNDGVIVTFHKAGVRSDPANYRPITLLNTDYRVLAKLLAYRLRHVQGAVIEPEQVAFLPGRLIGDNVMLLQLLPHALPASSCAAAVFLDFRKAYDTISRDMLYQLLQVAGLGEGFLAWVKLLLQCTNSCACVNGFVSNMVPVAAGVRQGCPLAPQLYLFVAQALLSHLKAKGFGVLVGSKRVTATQFADDAQVFLQSYEQVPELLQAMDTFKAATGQALNASKCKLVLVGYGARKLYWQKVFQQWMEQHMAEQAVLQQDISGAQPQVGAGRGRGGRRQQREVRLKILRTDRGDFRRGVAGPQQLVQQMRERAADMQRVHRDQAFQQARIRTWATEAAAVQLCDDPCAVLPDAQYAGIPLVGGAHALGVTHMADGRSTVDWQQLQEAVSGRYSKICKLPLSRFGRAFAASAYGLSKLLFAAEFVGMPPQSVLQELHRITGALVDRGVSPDQLTQHGFTGVSVRAVVGHPQEGGFGVMPVEEHIRARHAKWAMRLICGSDSVPWVHVARHILTPPAQQGAGQWQLALAACCAGGQGDPVPPGAPWLLRPTSNLPVPIQRLAQALQVLPQWRDVANAQLTLGPWCAKAPLWCNPFLCPVGVQGQGLPWRGLECQFPEVAALGTINTIQDALVAHAEVTACHQYACYRATVWPFWLCSAVIFGDWQVAESVLTGLVEAIPAAWRQAAAMHVEHAMGGPQQQVMSMPEVAALLQSRLGWVLPNGQRRVIEDMTVKSFTGLQQEPGQCVWQKYVAAALEVQDAAPTAQDAADFGGFLQKVWKVPWDNKRKEILWRLLHNGLPTAARMGGRIDMPCACGEAVPDWMHHFWCCPVAQHVVCVVQAQLPQGTPPLQTSNLLLGRVPYAGMHAGVWAVVVLAALNAMEKGRSLLTLWALQQMRGEVVPQHLHSVAQRLQVAAQVARSTFWDMLQDFVSVRLCPPAWLLQLTSAHPLLAVEAAADGDMRLCVHRRGQGA